MPTISIWGRLKNREPEVLDHAGGKDAATYLVVEYKMAFGSGWKIWAGKKNEEPGKIILDKLSSSAILKV